MELGRKGERVANTPIRVLPPSRGGRTVGDQSPRLAAENCDFLVSIPMRGRLNSLNASAAAAILLYEAVRQRMA